MFFLLRLMLFVLFCLRTLVGLFYHKMFGCNFLFEDFLLIKLGDLVPRCAKKKKNFPLNFLNIWCVNLLSNKGMLAK